MRWLKSFQTPSQRRRHSKSQNSCPVVHPLQDHWFNPIYVEPGSVTIDSTRDLQALFPNSFDCIGDMKGKYNIKTDPTVPPVQHSRWKVPIKYKEEIEKELAEMVWQRIITIADWAHTMGQQPDVPKEGKRQAENMPWPQDLNKAIIRENHKAPTLEEIAHILMGATRFSKVDGNKAFFGMHLTEEASLLTTFNTHLWKVQILTCSLRTENVPGHLPNEDGWHCGPMPWSIGHTQWCVHLRKGWQRPQCKHHQPVQRGPKRRTHVQQQEVCHKTRVHDILWWSVLCRRILPRSGKDPRHLRDDTTPDEARATIVPRSSELPPDIRSPSQFEHWTPTCPPQEGELLRMGQEHQHLLPENKVPTAESPPQTPEILWSDQTSHPPVRCLTQGAGSLHHSRWTAHCVCQQIPHGHWDPLCQHQERTLGHHIWLWKIPYIPVRKDICHGNRPQAPRDDQLKESHSRPLHDSRECSSICSSMTWS